MDMDKEPRMQQTMLQRSLRLIQTANQIAVTSDLDALLFATLDVVLKMTWAPAGTLHLYDAAHNECFFEVVQSAATTRCLPEKRFAMERSMGGLYPERSRPLFTADVSHDARWDDLRSTTDVAIHTVAVLLMLPGTSEHPVAVIQLFNADPEIIEEPDEIALLHLFCSRMATEIEKAHALWQIRRREHRMHALIEIATSIVKNLQPDQLLNDMMLHACDLLQVEATSIWLRDETTRELVLYVAIGDRVNHMRSLRVPEEQGIIGHVVSTGETVVVNDVTTSQHFYKGVDERSGFITRAILCVPLRAHTIQLGGELGEVPETIVGGVQALNKINEQPFSDEDVYLLETLAELVATILQFARLYEDTSTLFWGFVTAITSAIDGKDPWMRNHSKRVSDLSVAIAQELPATWWPDGRLTPHMLYHIRVGSLLHDVGKIRVGDAILNKPSHLDDEEMQEMRKHPLYGVELLDNEAQLGRLLRDALPALLEHHERLNGMGYPQGLAGEEISRIGRIVAVADAFEAITSNRPYRRGRPAEQALQILCDAAGVEYDSECVHALLRVYEQHLIEEALPSEDACIR